MDYIAPWAWQFYRGAEARPIEFRQGIGRAVEFKALHFGPHQLEITTTKEAGEGTGTSADFETLVIEHVYFDYAVAPDEKSYTVRLYDRRILLRRDVFPIDINVQTSDGNYRDGTRFTKMRDAIRRVMNVAGYAEGSDFVLAASDEALDREPTTGLVLAGSAKLADGLAQMLAGSGLDITVGVDGRFYFVDREFSDEINSEVPSFGWLELPTPSNDNNVVNGAPIEVVVPFAVRQEFVAKVGGTSVRGDPVLEQVYRIDGKLVREFQMPALISQIMNTARSGADPRRLAQMSLSDFQKAAYSGVWDGTPLQPTPYRSSTYNKVLATEVEAAEFSAGVVAQIARDELSLFRLGLHQLSGFPQGYYEGFAFGVMDDSGAVVPVSGDRSTVMAEWYEEYVITSGISNELARDGSALFTKGYGFGVAPFGVTDEGDGIIRISPTQSATAKRSLGRIVVNGSLREMANSEWQTINQFTPDAAKTGFKRREPVVAEPKIEVRFTAIRKQPNNLNRYHLHPVTTGIQGATTPEIVLPLETTAVANISPSTFTNAVRIDEIAQRRAQPVIDSYNRSAGGYGIANGLGVIVKYQHLQKQIDRLDINIGNEGMFVISTSVAYVGGGVSERKALEKRGAASQAVQGVASDA